MKWILAAATLTGALFFIPPASAQDWQAQYSQTQGSMQPQSRYEQAQEKYGKIMNSILSRLNNEQAQALLDAQNKWAQSEWPEQIRKNIARGMDRVSALAQPLEEYGENALNRAISSVRKGVEDMPSYGRIDRDQLYHVLGDSQAMYAHAQRVLAQDYVNARQYLLHSWHDLQEAKNSDDEFKRLDDGIGAWFNAVYARDSAMAEADGGKISRRALRDYNAAVMRSARWLGISKEDLARVLADTQAYLMGRQPDNCGFAQASIPVSSNLSALFVDNGIGQKRRLYFNPLAPDNANCLRATGQMCFRIIGTAPVTEALRHAGIHDNDEMTLIEGCSPVMQPRTTYQSMTEPGLGF